MKRFMLALLVLVTGFCFVVVGCIDLDGDSDDDDSDSGTEDDDVVEDFTPEEMTHNGITYRSMVSPHTGNIWLDRNLGANRICTSFDDTQCYGDYYQWGRETDGHEKANSATNDIRATGITNVGSEFITVVQNWTEADVDGLIRQANWNPCPAGYKVPSFQNLTDEFIQDRDDAFNKLKFPCAGMRATSDGTMRQEGSYGHVWSNTPSDDMFSRGIYFTLDEDKLTFSVRAEGQSVRCIKE
jgi:hypothetical protein